MAEKQLEKAIEIAHDAHAGQMRKYEGVPYIHHPLRVMNILAAHGHSAETQMAGVLHDVPEDSDWTIEQLEEEGFSKEVTVPLELLDKTGLGDDAYIQRLATNPRSRAVKKADIFDNMNLVGNSNPSKRDNERIERYGKSLIWLARFSQPLT